MFVIKKKNLIKKRQEKCRRSLKHVVSVGETTKISDNQCIIGHFLINQNLKFVEFLKYEPFDRKFRTL